MTMQQRMGLAVAVVAMLASPAGPHAQAGKTNFSGTWKYDQAASGRGTSGNGPAVSFPTDLVIKQTAGTFNLETSSSRQELVKAVYPLVGTEIKIAAPSGTTIKSKAKMAGDTLVIDSTRTFTSPAGPITNTIKEIYSLKGTTLSIEKTVTTAGHTDTGTAIYNKVS